MIAKTVVKNKYWIIRDGDLKVGEMVREADGYEVHLGPKRARFQTLSMVREQFGLTFEIDHNNQSSTWQVAGYPTDQDPVNPIYDLQKKLPLYTRSEKSKCWHAAGWYRILRGLPKWVFCPKVLLLDRYKYQGPFKEKP